MTFEEKLSARERQMDEMRAKLINAVNTRKQDFQDPSDEIAAEIAKLDAAFTLDKETAENVANEATAIDEIQKGTAEQIASAKGDIATADENARRARESRERKRDALQLRTQMKVNSAKEKIAARKEAKDKAEQEAFILDLLDYAESCYEMANSWLYEAEYTMMEATHEFYYYNERFRTEK